MQLRIFLRYLLQRFQLIPLSILVWSDVLVIGRITELGSHQDLWRQVAVFAMVICYLFSNRVGDDRRDFKFDQQYHQERALQQGLLHLRFLELLGYFALALMLLLAFFFGKVALMLVLPVWFFSLWAKYDFSLPEDFKAKYFYLYNFLNMTQMLVLQIFIYCALLNAYSLSPQMWLHIVFVFLLSLQVEVTRKIKPELTPGGDQYSDHMGMLPAIYLWMGLGVVSFICYGFLARSFEVPNMVYLGVGAVLFVWMIFTAWVYGSKRQARHEYLFWSGMIFAYVGQNLVLAYG